MRTTSLRRLCFPTAITDLRPEILEELADSVEYGVPSFKVFTVYKRRYDGRGWCLQNCSKNQKEVGALIGVHAENPDQIDQRTGRIF